MHSQPVSHLVAQTSDNMFIALSVRQSLNNGNLFYELLLINGLMSEALKKYLFTEVQAIIVVETTPSLRERE
jgi:hypothetical protein